MLADGTYDVIVVDAEVVADQPGVLRLDVALLDGEHKGEVVSIQASGLQIDEVDALGLPGTLTVQDGAPRIVIEP